MGNYSQTAVNSKIIKKKNLESIQQKMTHFIQRNNDLTAENK